MGIWPLCVWTMEKGLYHNTNLQIPHYIVFQDLSLNYMLQVKSPHLKELFHHVRLGF